MRIDDRLMDGLTADAVGSPRLRMHLDLRDTPMDGSQRMLNALEPGTELPVHRHRGSSETCVVLRGAAEELFYDERGNVTERVTMRAGTGCVGVHIERGRWHSVTSLEPGTVILEAKDGPYTPTGEEDILGARRE